MMRDHGMALVMDVDPSLVGVVRPVGAWLPSVRVVARETDMDRPIAETAERMRASSEMAGITAAVRTMYKRIGLDPTKTRPSSEALWRRVRKGEPLPRVNSLVDVINWCSLESQLPFGLYDAGRIQGQVALRLGRPGEAYAGIRKDQVHVSGRLVLAMVTESTTLALVVIFAPAELAAATAEAALSMTLDRANTFCHGRSLH
jgi:DNA/RNA-binding domain of Phe-tRNA-synthetase-like protein